MTYHQKNRGFTLIELLVVIAIIGVISGVVLQSLNTSRVKARNNIRLNQIDQIHKAFEIVATGGSNKLPYSGSNNDSDWVCLGNTSPCWSNYYSNNVTVNGILAGGMAGSVIPKDPLFTSGLGDSYLYHSNVTVTLVSPEEGAYISWVAENSATCGRGVYWQPVTNGYQCVLRIGNAVTN